MCIFLILQQKGVKKCKTRQKALPRVGVGIKYGIPQTRKHDVSTTALWQLKHDSEVAETGGLQFQVPYGSSSTPLLEGLDRVPAWHEAK